MYFFRQQYITYHPLTFVDLSVGMYCITFVGITSFSLAVGLYLTLVESRTGNQLNDFHDWSLQNNMSLNLGVMIFRFKKLPFPFGKIVNSVSKDFLNGNSVWPLTLYTKIPFTNQIKKKYELRIRVLSTALCIVKATVTLHVCSS